MEVTKRRNKDNNSLILDVMVPVYHQNGIFIEFYKITHRYKLNESFPLYTSDKSKTLHTLKDGKFYKIFRNISKKYGIKMKTINLEFDSNYRNYNDCARIVSKITSSDDRILYYGREKNLNKILND